MVSPKVYLQGGSHKECPQGCMPGVSQGGPTAGHTRVATNVASSKSYPRGIFQCWSAKGGPSRRDPQGDPKMGYTAVVPQWRSTKGSTM
jgi:hypothetical protein